MFKSALKKMKLNYHTSLVSLVSVSVAFVMVITLLAFPLSINLSLIFFFTINCFVLKVSTNSPKQNRNGGKVRNSEYLAVTETHFQPET